MDDTSRTLAKAREQLAAGHPQRALRKSWDAADSALRDGDEVAMAQVAEIADTLASVLDGKDSAEAVRLADYCRFSLGGAGVESHSVISRIARIGKQKRTCPDCAEKVQLNAKVCRYCGYRFDGAPA